MARQLRLDHIHTPYQLDREVARKRFECGNRTLDLGLRRMVSAHRVQRDADHRQLSSTSIRFLPA